MSRRCTAKPGPSARDLFIRDLFIGGKFENLFVLRFYGPVNPMGSCRARSVYLTTRLLGRLQLLFIRGKFVKDSATLGELEKNIVFKLKNQKKQIKFYKSQIEISNEANMLANLRNPRRGISFPIFSRKEIKQSFV